MLKQIINSDLKSLWDNNFVARASELNRALGHEHFGANTIPMHFTGNPEARTIMVMLNPGYADPNYNFWNNGKKTHASFDIFVENYVNDLVNFGDRDQNRTDNFDLKQAAFLHDFSDERLQIPREFWNSGELKLKAKRNVLMNKYQLELVPFCSATFTGMLDTPALAGANFTAFEPYLKTLLDEIFLKERRNVVFCSRQFANLFHAASGFPGWSGRFSLIKATAMKEGKLTLSCVKVRINHRERIQDAIIANSFPSRALPNAFEKMMRYGQFCQGVLNS